MRRLGQLQMLGEVPEAQHAARAFRLVWPASSYNIGYIRVLESICNCVHSCSLGTRLESSTLAGVRSTKAATNRKLWTVQVSQMEQQWCTNALDQHVKASSALQLTCMGLIAAQMRDRELFNSRAELPSRLFTPCIYSFAAECKSLWSRDPDPLSAGLACPQCFDDIIVCSFSS